jgi:hypothetical protein
VPSYEVGVPAQKDPRGDDQAQLVSSQQPGQGGQDRAACPGQPRGLDLPLEHGNLGAAG